MNTPVRSVGRVGEKVLIENGSGNGDYDSVLEIASAKSTAIISSCVLDLGELFGRVRTAVRGRLQIRALATVVGFDYIDQSVSHKGVLIRYFHRFRDLELHRINEGESR
jgi:hypothetical protein